MQSNINIIMVSAWMLWSSDAVEHERYYGLGMDVWSSDAVEHTHYSGFGMDTYSGHRMQLTMNIIMVWAWMLRSSDAVEREHYVSWFGHGCSDSVKHEH